MSYQDPQSVWEAHMGPDVHWKEAYAYLAERARTYLLMLPEGTTLQTVELVENLYDGEDDYTDQRIFAGLKALAAHQLADCWSPGEAHTVQAYGRTVKRTPKRWHLPRKVEAKCPHCGEAL